MTSKKILPIILAIGLMVLINISLAILEETDLPGSDFASFKAEDPAICEQSCINESNCQAWTWIRPGIFGPDAYCNLKNSVPVAVPDECCTSGVKGTTSATPPTSTSSTPASDQNQPAATTMIPIDAYSLITMSVGFDERRLAEMELFSEGRHVGVLAFYADGTPLPENLLSNSPRDHLIYYPYSRYDAIVNMLEGEGQVYLDVNPSTSWVGLRALRTR